MTQSKFLFKRYRIIIDIIRVWKMTFGVLLLIGLVDRLAETNLFNFGVGALLDMLTLTIFCHVIELEMYDLNRKRFTYEVHLGEDAHDEVVKFTDANPELKIMSLHQMEDEINAIKQRGK